MKIGKLDIKKAYYGSRELTTNNAFVGSVPLIDTPPTGWVTFKANQSSTIGLNNLSSYQKLLYSNNKKDWNVFDTSTSISMSVGDEIYIAGILKRDINSSNYTRFKITGDVSVSGNIVYLWNYPNPDESLKSYCGYNLFRECKGLTDASELTLGTSDTKLANFCYAYMFLNCTSLTTAPALPATTLASNCYQYMFYGCTSLTTAPELPATTLANYCYNFMFRGCTSLTTAPELPATTLAEYCYNSMFENCTSLTKAPELPATTLAPYCCRYMFAGCTSLTTAPELPATTLANHCYESMFSGCSSLTTAPEISATTLASYCCRYMFGWCTSLTTAPELPATILEDYCYYGMLFSCTNLNYIKCLATDISAYNCTYEWVSGVASTGTFISNIDSSWPTGTSGIPEGWDASQKEFAGLTFTAQEASTIGVNNQNGNAPDLWYSINRGRWVHWSDTYDTISLNQNDVMWVKGNNPNGFSLSTNKYTKFNITGNISISGSIMSLVNYKSYIPCDYCFIYLFTKCTGLKNASNSILPVTTLAPGCYQYIFLSCSSLTTPPELPATVLAAHCYDGMFSGCSSLTTLPKLSATALTEWCYAYMFQNCTSIVYPPELPATTLANYCYWNMFSGCTSLTTAPELPATILANYCYYYMFSGCTSLTTAPELPATTLYIGCYQAMLSGCTSLTTAPELPAITTMFRYRCYQDMFNGCSNLNYIKCLAVNGINQNYSTDNWVSGVASTGTFVKDPNANWPTGTNGIPTNWTVVAEFKGLTFTAQEDNSSIGLNQLSTSQTLEYSNDLSVWNTFDTSTNIALNTGDKVYIRGKLNANNTSSNYTQFKMSGKIAASGNTNSIWDYEDLTAPLKQYCGYMLFKDCTSLTTAPELPATTLARSCYNDMFNGCTSLIKAPVLPATKLELDCYEYMFSRCTSLTTAPELPATTLTMYCYSNMFNGCTSLIKAPVLPATKLELGCYEYMFSRCTSLTTAPELSATTLEYSCYRYMFYGCTSLTTAPELPATTLEDYCYYCMFNGCTSLNYIKCLAVNGISNYNNTYYWVSEVASTGTFVKDAKANWPTGGHGIPDGWNIEQVNYLGLKFEAIEDSEFSWSCNSSSFENKFYYSLDDGKTWANYTAPIPFSKGAILCLKGDYPEGLSNVSRTVRFALSGKVKASGNIMSLIDNGACNTLTIPSNYCFRELFMDCTSLITPPELPATVLAPDCYNSMFYGCISLTNAPELPATTLTNYCYAYMFQNCSALTTAPELPATILTDYCYNKMFYGCSSLVYPPALPATTLAQNCYAGMFFYCSSLVYPPVLSATMLADWCYNQMFYNCKSLIIAPELPATTLTDECYGSMFYNCKSLIKAPELPATTLSNYCYQNMFWGCSNLKYIKCLATDFSAPNCTTDWVSGVPSTGTFVKNPDANWPSGTSGIPSSWEVVDAK